MGLLSKFLRIRAPDRLLLTKVLFLIWMPRIGLWLLPVPGNRMTGGGVATADTEGATGIEQGPSLCPLAAGLDGVLISPFAVV